MHGINAASQEHILREVERLRIPYQLKRTLRYDTKRDFSVHNESVAEHVFALDFLKRYFLLLEDPQGLLDARKVDDLLHFHDYGEIKHGDVCFHRKTAADEAREKQAALETLDSLPTLLRDRAIACWLEYAERRTREAWFAYALDKIEPAFELFDEVNQQSFRRLEVTFETYYTGKYKATEHFPHMRRFLGVISEELLRRDVFWKPQQKVVSA